MTLISVQMAILSCHISRLPGRHEVMLEV